MHLSEGSGSTYSKCPSAVPDPLLLKLDCCPAKHASQHVEAGIVSRLELDLTRGKSGVFCKAQNAAISNLAVYLVV